MAAIQFALLFVFAVISQHCAYGFLPLGGGSNGGGAKLGPEKPATPGIQDLLKSLLSVLNLSPPAIPEDAEAVSYREAKNGKFRLIKVHLGGELYCHVKQIAGPILALPVVSDLVEVTGKECGKTEDDPLEDFPIH
ncbi:cystatin-A1-like [Engystomops pustulosus]|uniref:cystatin-A1-like n=1 Tax=Engystomops pustulosus TaxID=76066 RepID=UPI003AFB625E